jgi:hypothetical protein
LGADPFSEIVDSNRKKIHDGKLLSSLPSRTYKKKGILPLVIYGCEKVHTLFFIKD